VKILTVSDVELGILYSPHITERFHDIDLVLSCGDLPYFYIEYILSMLDVPVYFVRGNHHGQVEESASGPRYAPMGAIDLHRRLRKSESGLLLAGIEGSVRYNNKPNQYTQSEMWLMVWSLVPGLIANKIIHGRFLDVFISHAPPWGIQDADDPPHRGIKAFLWLDRVFKPAFHFHGHTHVYRSDTVTETLYRQTRVINTYGYRTTDVIPGGQGASLAHGR
jgi:Icc-related predicted phosphoesterase